MVSKQTLRYKEFLFSFFANIAQFKENGEAGFMLPRNKENSICKIKETAKL